MIVVTGANGFIGKNLLNTFPEDQDIIVVDYSFENLKEEVKSRRNNMFLFHPKDFLDTMRSGPCAVSFVFHQGACTDTMCYDSSCMLEKNYNYTYDLINLCVNNCVPIVYASSAAVYGDGPFEEDSVRCPKNIYAKSKSMIDDYVEMLLPSAKSQVTGLRYFNVYGQHEDQKGAMSSVINQFKKQIDQTGVVKIFKNSDQYERDFISVQDIVSVNRHFYENGVSGIFNCGTGRPEKFTKIPEVLKKYYEFDILEIDMPPHLQGKYQTYTKASLSKLRSVGKYEKEFSDLENGIAEYIDYWKEGIR